MEFTGKVTRFKKYIPMYDVKKINENESYDYIVWPNDITEDQKKYFIGYIIKQQKEKEMVYVVYTIECQCKPEYVTEIDYLLDRYPMSPKILMNCPHCDKGCLASISDPIKFYIPLTKTFFSLEELKKSFITESPQEDLLKAYKTQN